MGEIVSPFRRYSVEISIKGFSIVVVVGEEEEEKCKSPALISEQFVMLSVRCLCVLAAVPFWLKYREVQLDFTPEMEVFYMLFE